ncbi:MAG: endonuclease NucS domain-containing protein [Sphingopyxis sp.]
MKEEAFALWMQPQYTDGSVSTRVSRVKRVEAQYGDLDEHYDRDRLASLIEQLNYSTRDLQQDKPNPTTINITGDLYRQLASLKNAVSRYREFRDSGGEIETVTEAAIAVASESIREKREGRQFEIERHLQDSLRREIGQLEPGLVIVDDGDEKSVESGFIDILARDGSGALVVIELKAGMAKREAVGQITGYMGDLMIEEPETQVRGILVAADFDKSCQSGVRAIPTLKLKRYRFSFTFEEA